MSGDEPAAPGHQQVLRFEAFDSLCSWPREACPRGWQGQEVLATAIVDKEI